MSPPKTIQQVDDCVWEIPIGMRPGMRVPVRIFATEELLAAMDEAVFKQAANVATLPGIVGYSFVMPDAHWGYGFPIGGVAAFDPEQGGVVSAGGVGFDISCGVRTLLTGLRKHDVEAKKHALADGLFRDIPAGVGSTGHIHLSPAGMNAMLKGGAQWAVEEGFGWPEEATKRAAVAAFQSDEATKGRN